MAHVTAVPEILATAASDLEGIGSTLSAAATAAATPTTKVLAAAADEVSTAIAALFSGHAEAYQALNAEALNFHTDFVRAMTAAASSYASTEAASASPLQPLIDLINAPTQFLLQRPLIGNGANADTGHRGQPARPAGY